jgi:hypothetical protein
MGLMRIMGMMVALALGAGSALGSWYYGGALPAITFTQLAFTNTTGNQANYVPAPNFQVSANHLVLAVIINSHANPVVAPTLAGQNLSWVKIADTNYDTLGTATHKVTVWRSMTNALTPSGALTATFSDGNQTGCNIYVAQFGNVDTSGANGAGALVATNHNGADATANPSITLSALGGSGRHAVFATFGNDVNGFAGTAETDWVEDFDAGYNTAASGIYVTHRLATTDNTVVVTRASADWAGVAVEIKVVP